MQCTICATKKRQIREKENGKLTRSSCRPFLPPIRTSMEIMEEPPPAAGGDDDREVELPEDVLAEILRRLPPRSLAASRCVCTDWRSAIDSRRLLRPPAVARRHFHPLQRPHVPGVLLSSIFVTDNRKGHARLPATRRTKPRHRGPLQRPPFAFLSPCGKPGHSKLESGFFDKEFIVFDTTLSPHYEVFNIQFVDVGWYNVKTMDPVLKKSEWPPSPLVLHVFSSATGRWEERSFSREGDAAGTVASAQRLCRPEQCGTVYWRGALYGIMSDGTTYQVIKHPKIYKSKQPPYIYIGKSEKGVYLASLHMLDCCLLIWILNKSCGEWELYNGNYDPSHFHSPNDDAPAENNFEWYSDDDNIVENQGNCEEHDDGDYLELLGFHPYKEVIFLNSISRKGLAYHLNSSKLQHLGNLYPKHYNHFAQHEYISQAFPYTPCWVDELPEASTSLDSLHQD
uniref:F-box domain-containing protein n=1 Tax=Oryza sativa subsp. japonica TaxID=39947 RepID=Q6YYA0_ORYSJ|nr:hypothetical protein [Oryza sativa Japonica Group]